MAIVFQSERNLDSFISDNTSIGPGQYETSSSNINSSSIQNLVPFNTSRERLIYSEEDNPGPGSYFKNNIYKKSSISKKIETTKEQVLNKYPMYNLMLLIKDKKKNDMRELKIDKENKNQVQQIKYSNEDKIEQKNNKSTVLLIKKEKKEIKNLEKLNLSLESLKSLFIKPIERKINDINNEKEDKHFNDRSRVIKIKNKKFLYNNYSTNASSDININKQITSSEENSKSLFENNSFAFNLYNDKEPIIEKLLLKKIKKKTLKFRPKKIIWNNIKKNHETNSLNLKLIDEHLGNELKNYQNYFGKDPGPGYYSTRSSFDKYELFLKEYKKYNFGSNQDRNLITTFKRAPKKKLVPNLKIDYLNKSKKPSPILSQSKVSLINSINTNDLMKILLELNQDNSNIYTELKNSLIEYKNSKDLNIGPGQYNIKSQFEQKNKNKYSFPLEKRFFEFKGKTTPGPGTYLSLKNWNKYNNDDDNIKKDEIKTILKEFKPKYQTPDFNSYNPHVLNSIEYQNFINNSMTRIKVPFGSSLKKFIDKANSTKDMIGPGSYNICHFKKIKKKKIIKYPFISDKEKEKKEKLKILYKNALQLLREKMGPGKYIYNKSINNTWIKKTYNIKYI